ncbi:MAG: T9SS type A sorting domain-containing protein [Ignavibacteria bacterium]
MKKIIFELFIIFIVTGSVFSQWVNINNGIGNKEVYSLSSAGYILFAGTFNYGLYLSTDNGLNWSPAGTGLYNRIVYALTNFGGYLYAATDLGVWRSSNNGTYWSVTSINNVSVYSLASNQTRVFCGLHLSGLYYSYGGTGWYVSSLNATNIRAITVCDTMVLAGSANGTGVYKSVNNGNNWVSTSLNNKSVYSLAIDGNRAYAGTGSGIYRSIDSGSSWLQTTVNNELIYSLAIYGNNVFAGSETNGVYFSSNNGVNWVLINDGLGNITVYTLFIFNGYIYAGTSFNAVYRRPLSEVVNISHKEILHSLSVSQNFPNPFNTVTKISLEIKEPSVVSLTIYDMCGKEVQSLFRGVQPSGKHYISIDGSELASGVYFYKIKVGQRSVIGKMVLMK